MRGWRLPMAMLCLLTSSGVWAGGPPKLLRQPSLSETAIAFAHGRDLWAVDRSGGPGG